MGDPKYKIAETEGAFSEREILDETCRFGDWQDCVVFELKNSDPTDAQIGNEESTGNPIATETRVR